MNKIEALNDIVTGLGGTGGYKYEIQALNAWAVLVGAAGGYKYEIQALNAIDKAKGGTGLHKYNIDALNSICKAAGGSGVNKYEIAALVFIGSNVNQNLVATLSATGTGIGVSTLRLEVSEDQTFEITSGTARFYTDAAGTLGESTTWNVTAGELRTIYLKAPSGSSVLNIPSPDKVIKWGNSSTHGWESLTNAASISIEVGKLALTELRIAGTSTLIGALPTDLTYLYILSNSIDWTYDGALQTKLTYLRFDGNLINWTGLDVGNNGNITYFNLLNYRTDKMNSPDMVTLLTQLTNRTGTLPATITINDYADYASPPQAVTDAVAALKIAKSITTVTLGQ